MSESRGLKKQKKRTDSVPAAAAAEPAPDSAFRLASAYMSYFGYESKEENNCVPSEAIRPRAVKAEIDCVSGETTHVHVTQAEIDEDLMKTATDLSNLSLFFKHHAYSSPLSIQVRTCKFTGQVLGLVITPDGDDESHQKIEFKTTNCKRVVRSYFETFNGVDFSKYGPW